ncbi:MAG: ATP-binding cassette domain-containing protein [Gemmatimonadota bacterium]|nr:ATP-binding cassette domain-containing protein [Gemmatimonadota bacterium]
METAVAPRLEVHDVSMRFGGVVALEHASLAARAGEVTCLLGDNGAGKSTLIKIMGGVHPPTSGAYLLDGEVVRFRSPSDALSLGIATVYQDLAMVPLMSVWRNFFLGSEPTTGWGPTRRIDLARCREETRTELASMGIELRDPEQTVGSLSGGERQAVAIARALHFGARVLILDEPTAALGVQQSERVLAHVRTAAERGVAVVLVTHSPHHAFSVGDRFVVLRRGRVVTDEPREALSVDRLTGLMSGASA